jgi:hypothetical protein
MITPIRAAQPRAMLAERPQSVRPACPSRRRGGVRALAATRAVVLGTGVGAFASGVLELQIHSRAAAAHTRSIWIWARPVKNTLGPRPPLQSAQPSLAPCTHAPPGGLVAAQRLSKHFDEVVCLERDPLGGDRDAKTLPTKVNGADPDEHLCKCMSTARPPPQSHPLSDAAQWCTSSEVDWATLNPALRHTPAPRRAPVQARPRPAGPRRVHPGRLIRPGLPLRAAGGGRPPGGLVGKRDPPAFARVGTQSTLRSETCLRPGVVDAGAGTAKGRSQQMASPQPQSVRHLKPSEPQVLTPLRGPPGPGPDPALAP